MSDKHYEAQPLTQSPEGTWIVVLGAFDIPPHLVMIHEDKSYSLEHDGLYVRDVKTLMKFIGSRNIPVVLFRLKAGQSAPSEVYARYGRLTSDVTCLYPIRDYCVERFGEKYQTARYIFELIPMLEKSDNIIEIKQLNISDNQVDYVFPSYNKETILKHIRKFRNQRVAKK